MYSSGKPGIFKYKVLLPFVHSGNSGVCNNNPNMSKKFYNFAINCWSVALFEFLRKGPVSIMSFNVY